MLAVFVGFFMRRFLTTIFRVVDAFPITYEDLFELDLECG